MLANPETGKSMEVETFYPSVMYEGVRVSEYEHVLGRVPGNG
jgi:hypothetical protein